MTNLQTIAESLTTKCQGRAWIIVTAQEDMNAVLGDMSKQQSNDFSKIQARFANRLKLTSADVAEVIQKRLLTKNDIGAELLQTIYAPAAQQLQDPVRLRRRRPALSQLPRRGAFRPLLSVRALSVPAVPVGHRGISCTTASRARHSSVGERSMLGVFQRGGHGHRDHEPVGQLATFDRMFEGIRGALKSGIQSAINKPSAIWATPTPCACSRRCSWSSTSRSSRPHCATSAC